MRKIHYNIPVNGSSENIITVLNQILSQIKRNMTLCDNHRMAARFVDKRGQVGVRKLPGYQITGGDKGGLEYHTVGDPSVNCLDRKVYG